MITGSSRATGRPRSTISTGEPLLSPSIKALRLFLASVMLAVFITVLQRDNADRDRGGNAAAGLLPWRLRPILAGGTTDAVRLQPAGQRAALLARQSRAHRGRGRGDRLRLRDDQRPSRDPPRHRGQIPL